MYLDLLGYGVVAWSEHLRSHIEGVSRAKPPTFGIKAADGVQEGFQEKKDKERKLTLRSGAVNGRLEAIPYLILVKSMDALIWKGEVEWGCIFTIAKGRPTLHMGEAKEQPMEIQRILDSYADIFREIPKGLPPSRGFDHMVELESGAKPIILIPY